MTEPQFYFDEDADPPYLALMHSQLVGGNKVFDIANDTFQRKGKVHDWRNHVPKKIIECWDSLPMRERFVIAFVCDKAANAEE